MRQGLLYSYADRPFMIPIFDDPWRDIGLKCARQVGKSTILAADSLINCEGLAPYTDLILTPSQDQSRKFSHDRLGPTIGYSPEVRDKIEGLSNVFEKSFANGSKIYISYAKDNADRVRGITADGIKLDEVQDMVLAPVEAVVGESMFTSLIKRRWRSGTPKSMSNGIEQRVWRQSDQREWMVRCHHHGPLPFHQRLTRENVGKLGPVCKRCGKDLNTLDGQWVITCQRTAEGKEPKIHGYHIPQIIFPTLDRGGFLDWAQFVAEIEAPDADEATIANEKFGESADSEERPIAEGELAALCDPRVRMASAYEDHMSGIPTFAGVDWGHGSASTVFVVGQFSPRDPNIFRYLFFKRYAKKNTDPAIAIPDILRLCDVFRVHRLHADYGGGFGLNSQLREKRGEEFVTTNYWSSSILGKKIQFNDNINSYVLGRSAHLSRFFQALKKRQVRVHMTWDDFRPFAADILHEFKEERRDGSIYYDHKPTEPDDALHAAIYAWLAASFHKYGTEGVEHVRGQEHFPLRD